MLLRRTGLWLNLIWFRPTVWKYDEDTKVYSDTIWGALCFGFGLADDLAALKNPLQFSEVTWETQLKLYFTIKGDIRAP